MKKIYCLLIAGVVGSASAIAQAADIPSRPVYKAPAFVPALTWQGWYGGIQGGYGWGDPTAQINPSAVPLPPSGQTLSTFSAGNAFSLHSRPSGGFGGVLAGYNWQFQNIIVGIETDFSGSGMTDTALGAFTNVAKFDTDTGQTNGLISLKSKLEWFGTVRGRWGWMVGSALPYITAGLAYGHVRSTVTSSAVQFVNGAVAGGYNVSASFGDTLLGYAAGTGLDWALSSGWILRGEYLFIHLPGGDHTVTGVPAVTSVSNQMDAHLARFAIIHRFP